MCQFWCFYKKIQVLLTMLLHYAEDSHPITGQKITANTTDASAAMVAYYIIIMLKEN